MSRPWVRPAHRPYRLADGRIRIGGTVYGVAAELGDDTGAVWSLLSHLDGSRTRAEVASTVVRIRPDMPAEALPAAVGDLCASGHPEDAVATEPVELLAAERERCFFCLLDLTTRAPARVSTGGQPLCADCAPSPSCHAGLPAVDEVDRRTRWT